MKKIKYLKPSILKFILKDLFHKGEEVKSNKFHLKKGMEWLHSAYLNSGDDGVSEGYSLLNGWKLSNPGISGGIISTLVEYDDLYNSEDYIKIAREIANWLCLVQLRNGSFQIGVIRNDDIIPSIFSTGCVLSGLIDIYKKFKNELYEFAIIKAGNYLVEKIQKDGSWTEQYFNDNIYSYNIMTSWALLKLYMLNGNLKYKKVAINNIRWTYEQKQRNFWFNNTAPVSDTSSSLHFILYIVRGFLECGLILENDSISRIALDIVYILSQYFTNYKKLPMVFTNRWHGINEHCYYLTCIAQLSTLLLRLYEIYGIKNYLVVAINLNDYLKSMQTMGKKIKNFNGAIKNSNPIWCGNVPFEFSCNTTKFFCDALMLEDRCY